MSASSSSTSTRKRAPRPSTGDGLPSPTLQFTSSRNPLRSRKWSEKLDKYQQRWIRIAGDLPPQINRRHISVISIGGVIGTGLYIGTATALRHAGPLGTLLGYSITGSIVWAVIVSIGEIVSFLPNVGGPVGLAGLYVDPALGFALGWNAWYNWTIILPTELSAAAVLMGAFFSDDHSDAFYRNTNLIAISTMLVLAIAINCFGAKGYGEAEFIFSCIKILTIVILIIAGLALDLRTGPQGRIGFRYWVNPGPFVEYRAKGNLGRFLGIWSSINQAIFSFFGTEIPGVAAGEVQNPTKNIPRAVHRVWIRITLFYVTAVFVAGLLVSSSDPRLAGGSTKNAGRNKVLQSPFVAAFQDSNIKVGGLVNAAFVLSAFSAATSDVYISSRFLYFLARCRHAPSFCGATIQTSSKTVVPWFGILVASAFGLLAFMSASDAEETFHRLSAMNSTTALLAWVGMLWTYIRWYQGTTYAERKAPDPNTGFKKQNHEHLYANRNRFQPYIAIYALVMCTLILIFNGWFVFTRDGPWRMANEPSDIPLPPDPDLGNWTPTFVTSYLPLPLFVLLALGYKLIYR
ncbi:amino acid permease/ SLC12A domain-containing protein, partial [Mycena floridula]